MTDIGNEKIWSSIVTGLIWNPDTAICQRWLQEKQNGNPLGAPVTDELDDTDVTGAKQMAFTSGYVIQWIPDQGTRLL